MSRNFMRLFEHSNNGSTNSYNSNLLCIVIISPYNFSIHKNTSVVCMHDGLFFYKSFTLFSIIRVDIKMLLHRRYHFITVIKNETVSFNSLSDTYKDDDDLGIFGLHNEFLVKGTLCVFLRLPFKSI